MVLDEPAEIVTEVTELPPEVVANLLVPEEFEARFTVVLLPGVTGLPKESWRWTVIGPRVALAEAEPDTGPEVMASLLAVAAVMVSVWVALVSEPDAVMMGLPALVSP